MDKINLQQAPVAVDLGRQGLAVDQTFQHAALHRPARDEAVVEPLVETDVGVLQVHQVQPRRRPAPRLGRQVVHPRVAQVVDADEFAEHAQELVGRIGGEHAWATNQTRRLMRRTWETSRQETTESEAATLARALMRAR